jgi:hypothetical protein
MIFKELIPNCQAIRLHNGMNGNDEPSVSLSMRSCRLVTSLKIWDFGSSSSFCTKSLRLSRLRDLLTLIGISMVFLYLKRLKISHAFSEGGRMLPSKKNICKMSMENSEKLQIKHYFAKNINLLVLTELIYPDVKAWVEQVSATLKNYSSITNIGSHFLL